MWEARPDAVSGRLPWLLCKALLQPAWQVPLPILRGDLGANDVLELAGAEKRGYPLSMQQEEAEAERSGSRDQQTRPRTSSIIPNGSVL